MILCISEVVIGWEIEVYTAEEGTVDQIELCAAIIEGMLTFELPAINIGLEDGSAESGSDYSGPANPSSLVFSDSSTRQCTIISIVDDNIYEDLVEDFFVTLTETSSTPRVTVNPNVTQVEIIDSDSTLIDVFLYTNSPS